MNGCHPLRLFITSLMLFSHLTFLLQLIFFSSVFFPMTADSIRHVQKGIIMEYRRRRRKVLKDKIAKNAAGEEVRKCKQVMITDIGSPSSSVNLRPFPFVGLAISSTFNLTLDRQPSMKFRRFFPI
jgi:hypothetical protein